MPPEEIVRLQEQFVTDMLLYGVAVWGMRPDGEILRVDPLDVTPIAENAAEPVKPAMMRERGG